MDEQLAHHPSCRIRNPLVTHEVEDARRRAPRDVAGMNFLPWIGRSYGRDGFWGDTRLLVLGASHYDWCEACVANGTNLSETITCRCIAEIVVDGPDIQHWVNIEYALTGQSLQDAERVKFWQGIAYYNYVQQSVGAFYGAGRPPKPSREMWDAAKPTFRALIEEIEPDVVVVLGYELWPRLPEEDEPLNDLIAGAKAVERCIYRSTRGRTIVACRVRHPAAGLGRTWFPALSRIISDAPI